MVPKKREKIRRRERAVTSGLFKVVKLFNASIAVSGWNGFLPDFPDLFSDRYGFHCLDIGTIGM